MNKMKGFSLTSILTLLVLCFIGTTMVSASPGKAADYKPVADEMIGSNGITWLPKVEYAQLVLTVAKPDGTVIKKTFDNGSTPYLNLSDILTGNFCEGSYTYELRVIPADDKQNMHRKPLTQTGYFSVQGGAIKVPLPLSENISRAQSYDCFDEVIIEGVLCVGSGCECETLGGADEIVFKGVAPQFSFRDTRGLLTSYNSWSIICTDTGSSGYFAIQDSCGISCDNKVITLEALESGAPTNPLYVNKYGRIGLGTSTPAYPLEVERINEDAVLLLERTNNGATVKIGTNSNQGQIGTISDHDLNIVTNNQSRMTIEDDGKVGIGTSSPYYSLEVENATNNASIGIERGDGATGKLVAGSWGFQVGSVTNHPLKLLVNNSWIMTLNTDGSLSMSDGGSYDGYWNPASSREYKENIRNLNSDEAVAALEGLNPVKFNYKKRKNEEHLGFIAEDVPELVAMNERKNLSTMDIVAVLTKVVQQQQKSLEKQQKTISELKEKIADLEKK